MTTQEQPSLRQPSLKSLALDVLRQRLVTGQLRPGEIYSVSALAVELGVSNSPVREAMLELQNLGLVEAVRNRGFYVLSMSEEERVGVLEVRLMLEVPATAQLAGDPRLIASLPHFRSLAQEIMRAAREEDIVAFLDADRRFHLGILELHGNQALVDTVGRLRDRTRLFADKSAVLTSADEHLDILNALERGDGPASAELLTAHLRHVKDDWYI